MNDHNTFVSKGEYTVQPAGRRLLELKRIMEAVNSFTGEEIEALEHDLNEVIFSHLEKKQARVVEEPAVHYMMKILAINAFIQHRGKITLEGKQVLCVALDRVCTFEAIGEQDIELTDAQLDELFSHASI